MNGSPPSPAEPSPHSPLRIGNGAGFWGDQIDAPVLLAQAGELDALTLEYLAELTLGILGHLRHRDPAAGFVTDFPPLLRRLVALDQAHPDRPPLRIVTNAGGLNPPSLARLSAQTLVESNRGDDLVAVVTGDDVRDHLTSWRADGLTLAHLETGEPMPEELLGRLAVANVYLGSQPIAQAWSQGAILILTGRVADASLTVGPARAHFGWRADDWDRLAGASAAGHLIECGAQATGGLWHAWDDPSLDLWNVGYPIAELAEDGSAVITKPPGSGGLVTPANLAEQLVYEIDDPSAYVTPDVIADFAATRLEIDPTGPDRVRVTGTRGAPAPTMLKLACVARDGWTSSGLLAYVGPRAAAKARHAGEIVRRRLQRANALPQGFLVEVLGDLDILPGVLSHPPGFEPWEVVLRITARDPDRAKVERFTREIAPLVLTGPPGVAGYASGRPDVKPAFAYWPSLVPCNLVTPRLDLRPARDWLA